MYSSSNFIEPIGTNTTIKLKSLDNKSIVIISDPTCTIRAKRDELFVKQTNATLIKLKFKNENDAFIAHNLLRTALKTLNSNINNSNNGALSFLKTMSVTGVSANTGVNTTIALPQPFVSIAEIYINGVFVSNVAYTPDSANQQLIWNGTISYDIIPTFTLYIKYDD